jgi:hypothetical protein
MMVEQALNSVEAEKLGESTDGLAKKMNSVNAEIQGEAR